MTKKELPMCECGCGYPVSKLGNRFIHGHNKGFLGKTHSPETGNKISEALLGVPKSPKHCANISAAQTGVSRSPEACVAISAGKLGIPNPHTSAAQIAGDEAQRNPHHTNAQLTADDAKKGVPHSQEHIVAIKKGLEDAGVHERQQGGNDLVNHHWLYDHDDLSKNTVQMTRSDHMKLHMLLKKLGYKVPHINQ